MRAARELDYQPNAIARSLITRRSNMVAVVMSQKTTLYYPEILVSLSQQLSARGERVLLFTLESESDIDDLLDQMLQYQVDGLIIAARLSAQQIEAVERRRVPFVFYNRTFADRAINAVCCDQVEGEQLLVDRLVAAGHQRFGIIAGPADSSVGTERTEGALNRLHELGVEKTSVVEGDFSYASGKQGIQRLFAMDPDIDAVICANDVTAIGCIDGARHVLGKSVPDALSIVGFDGVGAAQWSSYDLTTVRQPVARMCAASVSMILQRAEDPDMPPEKRVFSGELVIGSSARLG